MHAHSHSHQPPPPVSPTGSPPPTRPSPVRWVFWGFVAIAAFFLWTEHRAHLIGGLSWLPYLFILACPLMHVFMHHGHGDHGTDGSSGTNASNTRRED